MSDDYRRRLAEALRGALDYAIVAEWICCDPLDPTHGLCCVGNTVRQGVRELLDDDEDNVVRAQILDALAAVRDEEIEKAREEAAYAVEALNGAENRRQMWRERAEKAEALLRDAKAALIDLGCCDDPDCSEQACNHVLPRISAFFAALEGRDS